MRLAWNKFLVLGGAVVVILATSGCDKLFQPLFGTVTNSAGGFYTGGFTDSVNGGTGDVTAIFTEDGRGKIEQQFADGSIAVLDVPSLGATTGRFTASYTRYTSAPGTIATPGSLTGIITPRSAINTNFNSTSPVDRGVITLSFVAQQYLQRASLSFVRGTYNFAYVDDTGIPVTATIAIDSNGDFTGRDTDGCTYGGTLSVPNADFNAYTGSLTRSCGTLNATFSVLGSYFPPVTNGSVTQLLLLGTDAVNARAMTFSLQR